MEDIYIICNQCDSEFVYTADDQLKHERFMFSEPRRCPQCRRNKSKTGNDWERKKSKTKKKNYRLKYDDSLDFDHIRQIMWR
jgi:hypothetical protein